MHKNKHSGESRGGARPTRPPPLFWVKKEEMTEERTAGLASKKNRTASGSATETTYQTLKNQYKSI